MSKRQKFFDVIYLSIFLITLTAMCLYILLTSDVNWHPDSSRYTDINSGWVTEDGKAVDLNTLSAGSLGGHVVIQRQLPEFTGERKDFCFTANNAKLKILVGNRLAFTFDTVENLTGKGCGHIYRTVDLESSDAGKTIRIEIDSVFQDRHGRSLQDLYICSSEDYTKLIAKDQFLPVIFSIVVIVFGLLILVMFLWANRRQDLPYNLPALGLSTVMLGFWCLFDTGYLQLLTGNIYTLRDFDYILNFLAIIPLLFFLNSTTRQRRERYHLMAFAVGFGGLFLTLMLRFLFGIDMHHLETIRYLSYILTFVVAILLFGEDQKYCKKRNLSSEHQYILRGVMIFGICGMLDVLIYITGLSFIKTHGTFMRMGLLIFVLSTLFQFLRWWSGEKQSIERDRFVNRLLQYALSENDTETSIHAVLEYLGSELHADRAYIFEEQTDHTFNNTYEWCEKGVTPQIRNLQHLPYEGLVDAWYDEYYHNQHILIYDIEEYKQKHERMYAILKPQGIRTLVTGPLMAEGKNFGFFGVDNPPPERIREISEILRLLTYFMSQLIRQRNFQGQLKRNSYYDALTGCKNRRAYAEFEKTAPTGSYGAIMCDINGLKVVNDTEGHEAGDLLIIDVSASLMEVFGTENVYRIGGDEFVVYSFDANGEIFKEKLQAAEDLIREKKRSASLGAVFSSDGKRSYKDATDEADLRMYREKESYYQGKPWNPRSQKTSRLTGNFPVHRDLSGTQEPCRHTKAPYSASSQRTGFFYACVPENTFSKKASTYCL